MISRIRDRDELVSSHAIPMKSCWTKTNAMSAGYKVGGLSSKIRQAVTLLSSPSTASLEHTTKGKALIELEHDNLLDQPSEEHQDSIMAEVQK